MTIRYNTIWKAAALLALAAIGALLYLKFARPVDSPASGERIDLPKP